MFCTASVLGIITALNVFLSVCFLPVCVFVQSVHPQLYIKGEGSAGKLQHEEQE